MVTVKCDGEVVNVEEGRGGKLSWFDGHHHANHGHS